MVGSLLVRTGMLLYTFSIFSPSQAGGCLGISAENPARKNRVWHVSQTQDEATESTIISTTTNEELTKSQRQAKRAAAKAKRKEDKKREYLKAKKFMKETLIEGDGVSGDS